MLPVSWYRFRILETQPWETRSWREMTQGRTPAAASSTIFRRMWLGSGRPLIKTPPSWFTLPCPIIPDKVEQDLLISFHFQGLWKKVSCETVLDLLRSGIGEGQKSLDFAGCAAPSSRPHFSQHRHSSGSSTDCKADFSFLFNFFFSTAFLLCFMSLAQTFQISVKCT